MRFDLTDLRLFLAVVDAGNITHGASAVGLSLPAASERLRNMEIEGEVKLLERGRRGVVPTEAGEALAHHARTIGRNLLQMRNEIGLYAKGLRSSVRVFANTAAIAEILPSRLAPWLATHPQADVELRERQSLEIAKSIASGFAEIGILSDSVGTGDLVVRPFAIDRLVVVVGRDNPIFESPRIRFADLLNYHFICLAEGALQTHIDNQANRLGTKLKKRVALRNFEGICRMAGAGVGLGIVPETAARRFRPANRIRIVELQEDWATRRLLVCVRNEEKLSPMALNLFQHLASQPSN